MPVPIQNPASFVPSEAVAFADLDGNSTTVSPQAPLPVNIQLPANPVLAGSSAAALQVGPFQPVPGRAVVLALSGGWTGNVRVLRSTDGGATRLPLTIGGSAWAQFTANCCEAVWEESDAAARLYLDIAPTSGTLTYRMGQ